MKIVKAEVIQDEKYPEMYRIRWPDGEVSDMVNRTRAKEAVRRYEEYTRRRELEGPAEPLGSPLMRLNDMGGTWVALTV